MDWRTCQTDRRELSSPGFYSESRSELGSLECLGPGAVHFDRDRRLERQGEVRSKVSHARLLTKSEPQAMGYHQAIHLEHPDAGGSGRHVCRRSQ